MRNFAALGLLGAAALAAASDVVDLKQDTFKGFVEENDLVLAECEYRFSHQRIINTPLTT
jgi:protein disulfide-isomerase A1